MKRTNWKYIAIGAAAVIVLIIILGTTLGGGNKSTPTANTSPAPAAPAAPTTTTPPAPKSPAAPAAQPVTVSGSGESVVAASGLKPDTQYKVSYSASGGQGANALIVEAVHSDGSTDSIVNDISSANDITQAPPPLSGSTVYTPTTASLNLHVSNDSGESWSVTFTPLG